MTLQIAQHAEADALLAAEPLALLIGMALDQQEKMEKAFTGPWVLQQRVGTTLDAADLAGRDNLPELFATVPAIHRFPGSMAGRIRELCAYLVEHHDGKAENVWLGVKTGDELLERLKALPGFGEQKATIFLALLGKQMGVRPRGWREAAGVYGEKGSLRSAADVTSKETLLQVRAYKQSMKAAAKAAKG